MKVLFRNNMILLCALTIVNSTLSQSFINIAPSIGISSGYNGDNADFGGGVSFADFNNDGFDDLTLATGAEQAIIFYQNVNGALLQIAPLVINHDAQKQILWVDYDNDGDKDLFFTTRGGVSRLYQNDGSMDFIDVTAASQLPTNNVYHKGAAFGDYNLDGWLDLLISNFLGDNILYTNNQDGTFTDVTAFHGVAGSAHTYMSSFLDFDSNLFPEIFAAQGRDHSLKFYENIQGLYTDETTNSGLEIYMNPMNVGVGDYDNDGDLDVYVTNLISRNPININYGKNHKLFKNNGDGTFSDVAVQENVINQHTGWGANWFDFDNDMDLDLYCSTSLTRDVGLTDPNYLFINQTRNGGGPFIDTTLSNDTTKAFANAIGDFDQDGLLDVALSGDRGDPFVIWQNQTATNNNNWIKVRLEGTISNKDGIGAWIEVETNGYKQYKYTQCGEAFLGQNSLNHHVGVGQHSYIDLIRIRWPSGIIDSLLNVKINQKINITEGMGITSRGNSTCFNGILDGDEVNVDCGGSCIMCDCTDDLKIYDQFILLDQDSVIHYNDYTRLEGSADLELLKTVEIYAQNFIEITQGQIRQNGIGNIQLDIEDCINKDFCYYSSLCSHDGFDIVDLDNYSMARIWMEILLESIRNDFARPTIHARNLYHLSSLLYDIWQLYQPNGTVAGNQYLINQTVHNFICPIDLNLINLNLQDLEEAMSYAAAKLLKHRFGSSPASVVTINNIKGAFVHYDYDYGYAGMDVTTGNPADIGNYIAQCYIDFGLQDNSNEINGYSNQYYTASNSSLVTNQPGNPNLNDPNIWQPLTLDVYIDQSGNEIPINTPEFLSPEWGNVDPFALTSNELNSYSKNGDTYNVYHDPGTPPLMDPNNNLSMTDEYVWGFLMVSIWGSHLDPNNNLNIDISPGALGNLGNNWPADFYGLPGFYDYYNGSDFSTGHNMNPVSGQPYPTQIVKKGDYARVLAEFWADGPDSETPPGHWFTILNYVSDHPMLQKRFEGTGNIVDDLEWDVKTYFTLGGAMHDAAISAWSIKGYYDYIRPISALRFMGSQGQRTDPNLPNYSINGLPIITGYSELVMPGDPLSGPNDEHLYKMKLYTWKGPEYINNPDTDIAGVDWILAENWWPYQRPSFVTPPFAGYVSGHSTFSRAAAEVMTLLTGDAFFPGGVGEFIAPANDFLVFENGPSQDIILQWATYRDASDQCSLSRIWGGIHPPADDIPGRAIGEQIGIQAFSFAKTILGF